MNDGVTVHIISTGTGTVNQVWAVTVTDEDRQRYIGQTGLTRPGFFEIAQRIFEDRMLDPDADDPAIKLITTNVDDVQEVRVVGSTDAPVNDDIDVDVLRRRVARLEGALRLVSVGRRPDGSWNRDREAVRIVADDVLNEPWSA
jgi:hypothetical protein